LNSGNVTSADLQSVKCAKPGREVNELGWVRHRTQ